VIAEHARRFGRDQLICDPWHYLPILERKPGALRNGVPFLDWDLPTSIRLVRDRILKQPKGDRVFVELLMMAREVGLDEMRRLVAPGQPIMLNVPDMLKLQLEPLADCGRYDHLREVSHVLH